MSEEKVIQLELGKLDIPGLKRIAQAWNLSATAKDKKSIIKKIILGMENEFFLKGVIEKLSVTQVTIYIAILKSKSNILTLGEISRKISMPPVNTEMELGVLKRYFLIYQRKNRERLTNNLDKYYYYPESANLVRMELNDRGQKFRIGLSKIIQERDSYPAFWQNKTGLNAKSRVKINQTTLSKITASENFLDLISRLSELERFLLSECFSQGGILDAEEARDKISIKKGKWEDIFRRLHDYALLIDDYYLDDKFVRLLIMPPEIFWLLQNNPLFPQQKRGTKRRQERKTSNELDFALNIKKMIVYISRKGLNLAKSGKIKQADLRDAENRLLKPDISLFIEKSEIYQIELLLPVMRLLDIVRVKRDDVVLRNNYPGILKEDPFTLLADLIKLITEARNRRIRYEDIFDPMYVPFFIIEIFNDCVNIIFKRKHVLYFIIFATLIREKIILSKDFRINEFPKKLNELRREITSALFYLQLLGMLNVEYPDRHIELSVLGLQFLKGQNLKSKDEKGGVIINPDLSLIAIPENLSLKGIYLLKSFMELKNFDNIYTFQLTRESFQEGLLLKNKKEDLIEMLQATSKNELSQNLLFSVDDWSRALPLVTITDECVVLQTKNPNHMELLLGQISGKRIVLEEISPTTILIDPVKVYETITSAEKLNLIVRLIR